MDCWEEEEMELELNLCCSHVKRKRKYSCTLDLFRESSCETVAGITESLGNRNNSSYASADPAGELKEQDLIRCLMKSCSSSEDNNFVSFSSGVDCTLSLGMPHTPEEQHPIEMFKQRTMQGCVKVIEIFKSKLHSPQITNSELEASYNIAAPFGGSCNISSVNDNVYRSQPYKSCWSTATNAATTSNPTSWFPITHSRSKFMDSKDILTLRSYATGLGSELLPTRPKKTSSSNPMNNNNGSSMRIVQQRQRSNITSDDAGRRCSTCHTTTTPLWRNGPKGAKSLCNACGIRYKKEERRVASAMAAAAENSDQFVKAPSSNSIVNHNNKITAASHDLNPLKKLKLQPIGSEELSLLTTTT